MKMYPALHRMRKIHLKLAIRGKEENLHKDVVEENGATDRSPFPVSFLNPQKELPEHRQEPEYTRLRNHRWSLLLSESSMTFLPRGTVRIQTIKQKRTLSC